MTKTPHLVEGVTRWGKPYPPEPLSNRKKKKALWLKTSLKKKKPHRAALVPRR